MLNAASATLTYGFVALLAAMCAAFVSACRTAGVALGESPQTRRRWVIGAAIGLVIWLAVTGVVAARGVLYEFDQRPPPLMLLFFASVGLTIAIGVSRLGKRLALGLPLYALVGFQAFRLPLELLLHRAYSDGVMPVQMSYEGWNFDIITGITALLLGVALARGRGAPWLVAAWNFLGFALLLAIAAIAVLSTPVFQAWGPHHVNVWICDVPFVWLPAVLVQVALLGHIVLLRRLLHDRADRSPDHR